MGLWQNCRGVKVPVRKRQSRNTLIGANCTCIRDWPVVGVVVPGRRHHVVVVLVVVTVGAPIRPVQTASVAWVEPPVEIWIVCWVFAWRIYHLGKMFCRIIKIDTCLNRFWKQEHESDSREPNELIVGSCKIHLFYVHFSKLYCWTLRYRPVITLQIDRQNQSVCKTYST